MDSALSDYGYDRGQDFDTCGAQVVEAHGEDLGDELLIEARLVFGVRREAALTVWEVVTMRDGEVHRRRYSYHFQYPGRLSIRWERDPVNHPENPEHRHAPDGHREPWGRVTFREVVDEVLDLTTQIEEQIEAEEREDDNA